MKEIEILEEGKNKRMNINILKYESEVWKTADLLIGAGIKQSDFPKYDAIFALIMVESS